MGAKTVEDYLAHLVDVVETGEYTNNPGDRGGPTRWGITQSTLMKWRKTSVTAVDVENLPREEALAIYRAWYVKDPRFDKLAEISVRVALELIDTGVNMGPSHEVKHLQRVLNTLNVGGAKWRVLNVDGDCGEKTIAAFRAYVAQRGDIGTRLLVVVLNGLQAADYIMLAEADPTQREWVYGWLNQRVFQNIEDWACAA